MAMAGIIVQARMGSSRLPGKVMQDLAGAPALERLFERLRRVEQSPAIVLATSTLSGDDVIADYVSGKPDIKLWRGSEQDVLKRYADAARKFDLDPIIRITADCPLIEPGIIGELLRAFGADGGYDYADNGSTHTFPHGYDVQIVSRSVLEILDRDTTSLRDREHVLTHIYDNPKHWKWVQLFAQSPHPELRITLDYPEDLIVIRGIYETLYHQNRNFGLDEILQLRKREPSLFEVNRAFVMERPSTIASATKQVWQR